MTARIAVYNFENGVSLYKLPDGRFAGLIQTYENGTYVNRWRPWYQAGPTMPVEWRPAVTENICGGYWIGEYKNGPQGPGVYSAQWTETGDVLEWRGASCERTTPAGYYVKEPDAIDGAYLGGWRYVGENEWGAPPGSLPAPELALLPEGFSDPMYGAWSTPMGINYLYGWLGDAQFPGGAATNRAAVEKILAPFGSRAIDLGDGAALQLLREQAAAGNQGWTPANANAAIIIQNAVSNALADAAYANTAKAKAIQEYFRSPAWQSVVQQSTEASYKLGVAHANANDSMSTLQQFVMSFAGFMKVAGPLMAATALLAAAAAETATAVAAPEAISAGETGVFDFDFGEFGDFSIDIADVDFGDAFDFGAFEMPTEFADIPIDIPAETFDFTQYADVTTDIPGEAFDFSQYADVATDSWLPEFSMPDLSFQDFLKYGQKAMDVYKQYNAIQQQGAAPKTTATSAPRPITQSPVPQYPVTLSPTRIPSTSAAQNLYWDAASGQYLPADVQTLFTDGGGDVLQENGISSNMIMWGGLGLLALLVLSAKDARA
jgi:hypothetical protein